jgi:hypothetical protein
MTPRSVSKSDSRSRLPNAVVPESCVLLAIALLIAANALARPPPPAPINTANLPAFAPQQFLQEYPLGVHRIPLDGGRIYGWKISDKVAFGRFKGENDEFGFSVELNSRQRVEITTDGLRWRRAIGGSP